MSAGSGGSSQRSPLQTAWGGSWSAPATNPAKRESVGPATSVRRQLGVTHHTTKMLRQWQQPVWLVKVKRHTGCHMNERADEKVLEVCSLRS